MFAHFALYHQINVIGMGKDPCPWIWSRSDTSLKPLDLHDQDYGTYMRSRTCGVGMKRPGH